MSPATSASTPIDQIVAGFPAVAEAPDQPVAGAPPVVFLHGAFADHTCFVDWVERFADSGYESVSASRRGRLGVGPELARGVTFDDYVADTVAVIDTLDEAPVLVGHSLGALIAQRLAEMGRARAIALLSPAPPAVLTAQRIALPRFAPNMPRIMSGRPFIVSDGACPVLAFNRIPAEQQPAMHAQLTHESGRVYRSMMMGTIRVDARKVTVPVMVASGTEDRIISTRLARSTARHYGAEAKLYEGHAHWIIGEPGWERVADDVLAWIGSATAGGR